MEGSEPREPIKGNQADGAYGSKQKNTNGRIQEAGYERKGSEWKDPSGGVRLEGSKRRIRVDISEQRDPSEWIQEEGSEDWI